MNAQNATYRGVELPAKYRRGLVRNVAALGLAFLSVGVYARASAELALADAPAAPAPALCDASNASDASGAPGVGADRAGHAVAR
ncbi:MAG TPA: hypothetical protein VFS00_24420 [Polyangiaceae bacterium]|nr:hypothetical protein [Polyangiaceae bacterium]